MAIELKIGEFLHEYVGKMQFYLAVFNDKIRFTNENPSIGIARHEIFPRLPENIQN